MENKLSDNHSLVKTEMIEMLDILKNHKVYEQFLQKFKQAHTETVTTFFMKYLSQSQRLVSRGSWFDDISNKLALFRAKLKPDVSLQVSLLMQQQCISETDSDIDKLFKLALTTKSILPKQTSLTSAAAVQPSHSTTCNIRCFFCDQPDMR